MNKVLSIQYLRAVAALMVVFHHARIPYEGFQSPLNGLSFGQAGVDIFFVISGFIMYSTAERARAGDFLRRRLIRIVPMYWIAILVTLLIKTGMFHADFSLKDIGLSLAFIPHYHLIHTDKIWPYLIPGWTLNFEMLFYGLFALALLTKRLILVLSGSILGLVIAGLLVKNSNALWSTYTHPLLLEFLAGIFIARATRDGVSPWWSLLVIPAALVLWFGPSTEEARVIWWGMPAAMIVLGAVAFEQNQTLPNWKILKDIGDASYSIYLFQFIAITFSTTLMASPAGGGIGQNAVMIISAMVCATGLGLILHHLVERPVTRALSKAFA